MDKTDQELVTDYLSGDGNALTFLIKRHLKAVYNFAYRFAERPEDADDIAQETFFKAWKNLKKFRQTENFRTWLFAIARNTAIDCLRKKKNPVFSDFQKDDGENTILDSLADVEPLPDELFSKAENERILEAALRKTPPNYREVLLLRYQNDFTFDEIGKILGKPLNTVKSQHRRALIVLRNLLSE